MGGFREKMQIGGLVHMSRLALESKDCVITRRIFRGV